MAEINHDVFIYADLPIVFEAISQPDKINQWWTKKCSGTPILNSEYNFYFSDEYNWFAKINSYQNGKSISWIVTKADKDWTNTILGFKLIAVEKSKTRVQFTHSGWKTANEHFRQTSYCWAMYLNLLKKLIENQVVTQFEQRVFT